MIILLTVGLIKKTSLYKMSYFPELHTRSKIKIKVELDLPNYGKNAALKGATDIDTSKLFKREDLARLKLYVNYLDIDKLKTVPVDLSKLSNVVKINVVI